MKKYLTKEMWKRYIIVFFSVTLMGICVQLLNRTNLGPDPCSALNYGISGRLHWTLGRYQVVSNSILFLFLVVQDRKLFGVGTIANMVLVGYAADLTGWCLDAVGILSPESMSLGIRFALLFPTLIVFIFAAAMYMNCGVGTSPYDAFPIYLHDKIRKVFRKEYPYKITRILYDGTVTLIAFLVGESAGIVTVLMVFTLGPVIDFVAGLVKKTGLFD